MVRGMFPRTDFFSAGPRQRFIHVKCNRLLVLRAGGAAANSAAQRCDVYWNVGLPNLIPARAKRGPESIPGSIYRNRNDWWLWIPDSRGACTRTAPSADPGVASRMAAPAVLQNDGSLFWNGARRGSHGQSRGAVTSDPCEACCRSPFVETLLISILKDSGLLIAGGWEIAR